MKILILNGSPKKNSSSTLRPVLSFVEGMKRAYPEAEVETVYISDLDVKPCRGCLTCWGKTDGECVIKGDDADAVRKKTEEADVVIESYPLYFFGMPGPVKVLTDRMLGMMNTYKGQKPPADGVSYHGIRKPGKRKFLLFTSCAYTDAEKVYESLLTQYDCICGKGGYTAFCMPQLKTLIDLGESARLTRYLSRFASAGEKFALQGCLSKEDIDSACRPPFTEEVYRQLLNNFWSSF